jgi:hypothetical protein
MPDWQKLVDGQLAGLVLEPAERADVIAELATHLEQVFEEWREQGLAEEEAVRRTLSQVEDWHELRRRIQIARVKENLMSKRVSQIWLPGFLTLLISMSLLLLIQFLNPNPIIVDRSGWYMVAPVMVIYLPWLLSLPLIGALGAYLSHRAGASQRIVLLSILFPVLPYLTFFMIGFPIALIVDDHVVHNIMFAAFFTGLVAWVLLPATALLAGGLPTQLYSSRSLAQRGVASH